MRFRQRDRTPRRGAFAAGLSAGLPAALAAAALATGADGAEDPRPLARSIYVPVAFEVAPCLRQVLVRNDEGRVRAVAPGRLVSQFTWYGGRRRLEPEWERLTVEGEIAAPAAAAPGAPADRSTGRFRAEIVITPTSIYHGRRRLALDPDLSRTSGPGPRQPSGFPRLAADFRYGETELLLRPAGGCGPQTLPVSAASAPPPDPR